MDAQVGERKISVLTMGGVEGVFLEKQTLLSLS